MKAQIILLLLGCACMAVLGCRSDQTASADPAGSENGHAPAEHASAERTSIEHTAAEHTSAAPVAATVEGRVSGFDCAVVGELCPTTHRGGDYTTGVYTSDGQFYFVVNIPQSFMSQHFLETVAVEGRVYPPYDHAVEPEIIHVLEGDDRRTIYESGYFIDEEGRRATFHDGRFVDGRWVVE